jgi:hypothetical protein
MVKILAKHLKYLPLVYTQAAKVREDRYIGGHPFLDFTGATIRLGYRYLDRGDASLLHSLYEINTLQDSPGFDKIKAYIFGRSSTS